MRIFFGWLAVIFSIFTLVLWSQTFNQKFSYKLNPQNSVASVFFTDSITASGLQTRYQSASEAGGKIKILIVPGHDAESGGTEFLEVRESSLNLNLAKKLATLLAKDSKFQVILARDDGGYNPDLEKFLAQNSDRIGSFIFSKKTVMQALISDGAVERQTEAVFHNNAPADIARRLYGINLWANEIKADLVLHIHFNDYAGRPRRLSGEYDGFALYVPEKQFSNSAASRAVANRIFNRLQYYYPVSNLPKEDGGIVEDQSLIAVGSYNTLDAVGMLIEYGYIYEERFRYPLLREHELADLALQTELGLQDFFAGRNLIGERDSAFLPFAPTGELKPGLKGSLEVASAQVVLRQRGFYPPPGKDLHSCPISGNFLDCTALALESFQQGRNINDEAGILGPMTREALTVSR